MLAAGLALVAFLVLVLSVLLVLLVHYYDLSPLLSIFGD
jgi:multisubunit Na+/H+ antiporter MnhB subunit